MADFMRNTSLQPMGEDGGAGGRSGPAARPRPTSASASPATSRRPPAAPAAASSCRRRQVQVDATLRRFGRTMERHVQGFMNTQRFTMPSGEMTGAIAPRSRCSSSASRRAATRAAALAPAEMVDALREQKQALKSTASTQEERATIEVVALLFQSILTEDRIPSAVRVWFARLQMPTLRVAMAEPDFFSSAQHPARRLIDRMGACVMGFDAAPQGAGPELEGEVARVVQVVEAFPETGRKVFQTVLVEFERFIEKFFRDQNETTKKGVSLASQVEQRETLAIQYTIELRKLLDGVPVQDGVREFLFQVWADVLATTAMRHGLQSDETRVVREAALELVWIASAKTTREERAEVIRRLGPLLASLRQGMLAGGLPSERQETSLRALNIALTAAFAARTATIDPDQLGRLKQRLEALDEILPDADFEIDDSFALDLSGHESDELEIVAEGGSTPSAGALAAADEMLVGAWYMLEYRDRQEAVQLAWQGMRKQLSLFVSARGRCVLFQRRRLAAFLQAQLLMPAQDESLTIGRHAQRDREDQRGSGSPQVAAARHAQKRQRLPREPFVMARRASHARQWIRRSSGATNSSSRISASGSSPRLQNTIRMMIFMSSRSSGLPPAAIARSITISRIGGGSTPADSRKVTKPTDVSPSASISRSEYRRMASSDWVPV